MGGGVDQPGGVQADDDAERGAPEHHGQAAEKAMAGRCEGCADGDLQEADDGERGPVEFAEPDMAGVAGEVGGAAAEQGPFRSGARGRRSSWRGVHRSAVVRGVRVAVVVGILTRWVATQKMGPPSSAMVPQAVTKYSTHLGVR